MFVDMIKQVLDGNLDGNTFEDMLREMFGIHAYIGFTMDKVVQNICRQLQHLACDETCSGCTDLFLDESKSTGGLATGGTVETQNTRSQFESAYQKNAEKHLQDENCFKLLFFKSEGKVTIELLDTESPESEAEIGRWSAYVDKYVREDETISDELKERLTQKPVFLPRNIANWRKKCAVGTPDDFHEKSRSNSQQSQNNMKDVTASAAPASSSNNNNNNKDDDPEEKVDADNSQEKVEEKPSQSSAGSGSEKGSNDGDSNKPTDLSLKDVVVQDNEQCRFNVNSYKMLYIVEGESYIYRKNSLKRAKTVSPALMILIRGLTMSSLFIPQTHKRVSQNLYNRFNEFHSKWLEQADPDECASCQRWLDGEQDEDEDHSDNEHAKAESSNGTDNEIESTESRKTPITRTKSRTKKLTLEHEDKAPFRTFYRYIIEKETTDNS